MVKIIHQTWVDSNIPKHYQKNSKSWLNIHTDWEYKLWLDSDIKIFIKDKYPQYLTLYNNFKHKIQRVDFAKYLIIFEYGGLYVDMDVKCFKSINLLLNGLKDNFFYENVFNKQILGPYIFYSPGKTIALNKIIKHIHNYSKIKQKHNSDILEIMNTTGPYMLNLVLNKQDVIKHSSLHFENVKTLNSYGKHYKDCNWYKK